MLTWVLTVIGTIVGGVVTYYFTEHLRKKRSKLQKPQIDVGYQRYSGTWFGLHITSDRDGTKYSNHEYSLRVNENGRVEGEFKDFGTSPETIFTVSGTFSPQGLVLISEREKSPGFFAVEFYPGQLKPDEKITGILTSFDFNNDPFATVILLSRETIRKQDLKRGLEEWKDNFYLDAPSN